MDDKLIEKEFEIWIVKPTKGDEKTFTDKYHGSYPAMGFYAGFRAAERLAKIDVLKDMLRMMDKLRFFSICDYKDAKKRIESMLSELKAGQ